MKLTSSVFEDGNSIPAKYTCDGANISPPLSWEAIPAETKSLVLIVDDPDAPNGTWDHWVLFNIPTNAFGLEENISQYPLGTQLGSNSFGKQNYGGPCPPKGEHRYYFKLYALNTQLNLAAGATKSKVETAMKGSVIDQTQLMGKYKRG